MKSIKKINAVCIAVAISYTYSSRALNCNSPFYQQYQYAVKDDYSGVDFSQNENRDGYATSGSYSVALPDGRIQTVTYTVTDGESGYVADVSYQGEAQYPKYEPKPAPAYKPAPAPYKPAPAPYKPAPAYPAPHSF